MLSSRTYEDWRLNTAYWTGYAEETPYRLLHADTDHAYRWTARLLMPESDAERQWNAALRAALTPDFGEDYPGFGNPKLTTEKAWHYSTGIEWRMTQTFSLDGTVFYKSLHDLVSPTDRTTTSGGTVTPLIYDNGGRGRVRGFDVLLRKNPGGAFTGWLAYTLSRSERRDSGATTYRLFDYDQTHILTVLGSYAFRRNITVSGRFRYVSGNPRTPVVGSVMNASADRYEPLFGAVNSARNPAFHQLDLRVDKRWIFDRWMLNVYLDVQNVYNHKNPEGLSYSYDYSKSKAQGGLPILALFGVRADL